VQALFFTQTAQFCSRATRYALPYASVPAFEQGVLAISMRAAGRIQAKRSPDANPAPQQRAARETANWRRLWWPSKRATRAFAVPDGLRIYAIGDIHGCHAELQILLNRIEQDICDTHIAVRLVYLGDYIDRGPASKEVVSCVLKTVSHIDTIGLRGNHEQMLLDFLEDPTSFVHWRDMGGRETLLSYGVVPPQAVDEKSVAQARDSLLQALPEDHLRFFRGLSYSTRIGDYFFVHAGVRPGAALDQQSLHDMLWIREPFLRSSHDFGAKIVHGHTPGDQPVCRANRIGLDTGAYATGCLTAAVLEGAGLRFLHTR
jgi:serine/threonine protein phosphatase 1